MFGYTIIKDSELELLLRKARELDRLHLTSRSDTHRFIILNEQLSYAKTTITELEREVLKYKELYVDELQKRLAIAKEIRESEVETEDA